MENKVFKVGIIGAGFVCATGHIPALLKLRPNVVIAAIADTRKEAAEHVAACFGIERIYTDPYQLLKENDLDMVHICTPNCTHKELTIAALRAGCNVLCEKPLALSVKDAQEMFDTADEVGKQLFSIQNTRIGPIEDIKRIYESGELGEVYYVELESIRRRGVPTWGRFHVKEDNGGGAFCDVGVHLIDAMMFALGNPRLKSMSAAAYAKIAVMDDANEEQHHVLHEIPSFLPRKDYDHRDFSVEEFANGFARFDNGMNMQMKFAWAVNMPSTESYRILGTKAGIILDKNAQPNRILVYGKEGQYLYSREINNVSAPLGHDRWIDHIIRVVQGKEEPMITRDEMLNVVSIIEAFYKSAGLEKEV